MSKRADSFDICFGAMNCDENGKVRIPPEYAYKISFREGDCMVIPLEGGKEKRARNEKGAAR